MPIISTSFNDIGNAGQVPNIVRMETDDSLATVLVPGYLNVLTHQNLPLSETSVVLVSTGAGVNKAVTSMRMSFSGGDWSLELLEGYQESLDNLTLPTATVASGDKVLIQDISDSNKLKTVTAQSIADLGGGGGGVLQAVSVPMTSAEFKDLLTNPKLIVAAPGAGKLIVGYSIVIELLYGTTQYADGSGVALYYGNGDIMTAAVVSDANSAAIFNFVTSDTIISNRMYVYGTEYYYDATAGVNMGVYLRVDTTDFTTGDSDFVVHFTYQVLNVTAT